MVAISLLPVSLLCHWALLIAPRLAPGPRQWLPTPAPTAPPEPTKMPLTLYISEIFPAWGNPPPLYSSLFWGA